ncbi:MAG: PD-(D/E)XK nuclease family protein [Opitutaceae bacterium]|nr:PD-(D/E)XK nuclease family protein [Opitutaceae bacterium]
MEKVPEALGQGIGAEERGVHRHVLPWNRPLPRSAAEWLARDWAREGPLDLATWLVIVPTRQSGRRLREALAALASEAGQAVLSPRVVLPESLISMGATPGRAASRAQFQLAWVETLQAADLNQMRAVFPVDPTSRSFTWARELAKQMIELQEMLREGGVTIGTVAPAMRAGSTAFPEEDRWVQLTELSRRVALSLSRAGLRDPIQTTLEQAEKPVLPEGIEQIAMMATPDPLPLSVKVLARLSEIVPVSVVIHGPPEASGDALFDAWGRPNAEAWSRRHLDWTDFKKRVHLCADAGEQTEKIVALVRGTSPPGVMPGIGIADTTVLPVLKRSLERTGFPAYNPAGKPWRFEGFYALLSCLAEIARSPSWDAVKSLIRCPDVLEWLRTQPGRSVSGARILSEIDALGEAHLPPTLSEGLHHTGQAEGTEAGGISRYPAAHDALTRLHDLRKDLVSGTFPLNAVGALKRIFAGRRVEEGSLEFEAMEAWMESLREADVALSAFRGGRLDLADAWEFALALYGERVRFEAKEEGALELNGWLELLWEDAPHLVVAGMNEGCVPESVVGDAFLPEAARRRIGLKNNAMRYARDAYLLHALAASRDGRTGRIDLLVGKAAVTGDPLRPSRLLLQCADEELPDRVGWLFQKVESHQATMPWTRAWRLKPAMVAPPERVSVTALRDWLECPFRFYLKHALKMRRVEIDKAELDARDFGNLLHATLQRLADPDAARIVAAKELGGFLLSHFEREASARYGDLRTLPLLAQFESARQRILKAAEIEAEQRESGWRTLRVEWKFELPANGIRVRGVIDRVDRNEEDPRRVRVVDYKTSDKAVSPAMAHLRTSRDADAARDPWQRFSMGGKEHLWTDLQLPVYRHVLEGEFGSEIECGYFNLPKAVGDSALCLWSDFPAELQRSADACLDGITKAIAAGRFWPPAEFAQRDLDDWAELFHRGAAESVDPSTIERLMGERTLKGGGE